MHELSLMLELRQQVLAQLALHKRCRVVAITLRIGLAAGVDADALALAFACAMDGTPAATARLTIEPVAGRDLVLAAMELG